MTNSNLIRQGDVPMVRISKEMAERLINEHNDLVEVSDVYPGKIVLALGETSGHAHVIENKSVGMFPTAIGDVVVVPVGGADLKHIDAAGNLTLEHATINLEEGYWLRVKQREFTLQGNRDVID